MRASRAELAGRASQPILALAAILLCAAPAWAQIGRPVPLLPSAPAPAAPVQPPGTAAPAAPAPSAPQPAAPVAPAPTETGITTQPLSPVDTSWTGQLGAANGGLPHDMWQGSSRAFVAAALPELAPTVSPVLQALARQLLLSNADAPAGQDAPGHPTLAALRLDRILALGLVAQGQPLLGALPPSAESDAFERTRIELQFAANDIAGACGTVQAHIAQYQDNWWDRALIACQALNGERAKAAFGLSLMAEQRMTRDPVFAALIAAVDGHPRRIERLPDPSPLRVALLAAAKLPLPGDALTTAGPAALYGYATNAKVPVELRLPAAERAALLGALAPPALAKLYAAVAATPDEQTAALAAGKQADTPRRRAILYQIAASTAPAQTRAAALAALFSEAKTRGAFLLTANLLAPFLADLPVADTPPGFAGDMARALLASGHADAAGPWLAAAGAKALMLVAHLAAPDQDGTAPTALLAQAITALSSRDSAQARARSGLLVTLVAALEPLGPVDWSAVLAPPHQALLPSPALWVAAADAVRAKRVGDTVLTTLLIAQAGGALSREPVVLGQAITALRAIGQDAAARALAVEAALDAGL